MSVRKRVDGTIPDGLSITQMLRESGTSGTKNFSGILSDEYLPQLSFYQAPTVYNQMRRSDATIAALIAAYTMPLRAAKWYIQPHDDSPESLDYADFIHDNLWSFGTQTFDDFLREALTFLPFGFSWFEKVFSYIEDGDHKGKLGWDKFAFRYQTTRYRYNTKLVGNTRKLVSVTQFAPPDYHMTEIPVEKLLIFSHQKEGDNHDGIALLRSCYKHWYMKEKLYMLQVIGLERSAIGVPFAKYLQSASQDEINTITQMVENLRFDDQAAIQYDGNTVEIGYLANKFDNLGLQAAIEHHDTQIMKSGLAQFVNLGTRGAGTTGSYALSQDQSQMFLDALNGEANYFGSAFHLQATMELLQLNYKNVTPSMMPRLSHGDIGQQALVKLAQALNSFAQYGFITPDPHTENVIREIMDLPPRDEDWRDEQVALNQTPFPERDDNSIPNPAGVPGNGIGAGTKGNAGKQQGTKQKAGLRTKGLNSGKQIGSKSGGGLAAHEKFAEALEEFKQTSNTWKPERPSIKAARTRRPYEIITEVAQ